MPAKIFRKVNSGLKLAEAKLYLFFFLLPQWYFFRFQSKKAVDLYSLTASLKEGDAVSNPLEHQEEVLRDFLLGGPNSNFLEIGIGTYPHVDRVKLMLENGISYNACDFAPVCQKHLSILTSENVDTSKLKFFSNSVGTYAWTLMELLKSGKSYDIIYLDGHHTFYIDLPAFFLADQLLKPEGLLLVDDMRWTLSFMRWKMYSSFEDWHFYHKIYKFDDFSADQQQIPHIGMVVEDIMIKRLGYLKQIELMTSDWIALRKPKSV